jgi:hypothetical protein
MIYQKISSYNCAFSGLSFIPFEVKNEDEFKFHSLSSFFGLRLVPKKEICDWIFKRNGVIRVSSNIKNMVEGEGDLFIFTEIFLEPKFELEFMIKFGIKKEIIIS